MTEALDRSTIDAALCEVFDPETGIDIVNLGLIYDVDVEPQSGNVRVVMTLTTPSCPAGDVMMEGARRRLSRVDGVANVEIELTFEPRWTPSRISQEGRAALGLPDGML